MDNNFNQNMTSLNGQPINNSNQGFGGPNGTNYDFGQNNMNMNGIPNGMPQQPKKKKKTVLIIVLVVVSLLLCCCCCLPGGLTMAVVSSIKETVSSFAGEGIEFTTVDIDTSDIDSSWDADEDTAQITEQILGFLDIKAKVFYNEDDGTTAMIMCFDITDEEFSETLVDMDGYEDTDGTSYELYSSDDADWIYTESDSTKTFLTFNEDGQLVMVVIDSDDEVVEEFLDAIDDDLDLSYYD